METGKIEIFELKFLTQKLKIITLSMVRREIKVKFKKTLIVALKFSSFGPEMGS